MTINLTRKKCDNVDCDEETIISDQLSLSVLSYTFPKKLDACAEYEYKIIELRIESGIPTVTENFTSNEQLEIVNITISEEKTELSTNILHVSWNAMKHLFCPKRYRLEVEGSTIIRLETQSQNESILSLEPCEIYNISISSLPSLTDEPARTFIENFVSKVEYKMLSKNPSKIRDLQLKYNDGENEVLINWTEPERAKKCIKEYEIIAKSEEDSKRANVTVTETKIGNVFACNTYEFSVIPRTDESIAGETASKEFTIPSRGQFLFNFW